MKSIVGVVLVLVSVAASNAALVGMDSTAFESKFEMNVLPSSNGWTYGSDNGNNETYVFGIADGKLTQSIGWGTAYYVKSDFAPDISNGFTIEWAMNATNIGHVGDHGYQGVAMSLALANGKNAVLSVFQDRIVFEWDGTYPHMTYTFDSIVGKGTIFRMAVENNNTWNLFKDGQLLASFAGQGNTVSRNSLLIGSINNDGDLENCYWDYVRYTNSGAFAPVPEPATMLIFAIGGLLSVSRRKSM